MAANFASRVVSLRFPNEVIEAVDEACEAGGESRTGWVMDACRRKLGTKQFAESFEVEVRTGGAVINGREVHLAEPERIPIESIARVRPSEVTPRWKSGK